jgi:hypothetical protein
MKLGRLLLAAIAFLAAGLWTIIYYCHGSTGLNLPINEANFHVDLTTTGLAVLIAVPLIAIGATLLAIAVLGSLVVQFLPRSDRDRYSRREEEDRDHDEERTPSRSFLSLNG